MSPQVSIPIATGTDDQVVYRTGPTYPPSTGTFGRSDNEVYVYPQQLHDGASAYWVAQALLRFDTGNVVPDNATVTAATLRCYFEFTINNSDSRSVTIGYYAWDGVSNTDWTDTVETNAHAGTPLSSLTLNATYDFALINLTNVSLTGYTSLRMHVSGGAPSNGGFNRYYVSALESTNPEATLIVDYTLPVTRIAPDAILAQTNLTGAVSTIQDDPDSPDANWLTAP